MIGRLPGVRVEVLSGRDADEVARLLREHDRSGLVTVAVVDRPGLAAVVVGTGWDVVGPAGLFSTSTTPGGRWPLGGC
ncbi:hypothetical protein ACQPZF_01195 [Actinosynnema sp. CS-041913]|uniref:hypothetical protein n=1 Tax=Actinosynnema sp. CS-041913 TaxID=3239917 RepID=UPI003D89D1D6